MSLTWAWQINLYLTKQKCIFIRSQAQKHDSELKFVLDIEFELNLTNKSNQTQTFGLFNEISQTLFIDLVRIQAKHECLNFILWSQT